MVITLAIIIAITTGMLVALFATARKISGKFVKVDKVENLSRVGLEYFVTYIIPFVAVDFLAIKDIISVLILFGVMGVIYVKTDLIFMNPVLNLVGFNIYKIISEEKELVVISRKRKDELRNTEEVIELGESVVLGLQVGRTA